MAKLTIDGVDLNTSGSSTSNPCFSNIPMNIAALPFIFGSSGTSAIDIDIYTILGTSIFGYIEPVTNGAYPQFTPTDGSGTTIPFSASAYYSYSTSVGAGSVTNQTSPWTFGIPWYNTGSCPSGLVLIEGSGYGFHNTSWNVSPQILIRSVFQYNNSTVYRNDAITLGTGQSQNEDFNNLRITFNSGNLWGAFAKPVWKS